MERLGLRTTLDRDGYAFLEAWAASAETEALLRFIGEPIGLSQGNAVHRLVPKTSVEAMDNTYSGAYGLGRFPLHTDLAHWHTPPRYFILRCMLGFEAVPTLILDGAMVIARIDATILGRALMQPRRAMDGQRPLLRLYEPTRRLLRWDERYIVPATDAGITGVKVLRDVFKEVRPNELPLFRRGDTLVVDNWRILHGRASVPGECKQRVIERAYLRNLH